MQSSFKVKSGYLLFLLSALLCLNTTTHAQKKNLLFIITDQQRYDALGYAGNTVIKTPNLDRLAERGVYFANAYTPCAVCGPSRSSILTGTRIETNGVKSNSETYYYTEKEVMTMPTFDEILDENGYHCEYYGKWHAMSNRANVYKNPQPNANNGNSVFGPGGQSHIWRDYLNQLGAIPEPGNGQFVDGMSKYPYIANPLDRFYGWTYQQLQNSGSSHSQPDQHGKLLLNKDHTLTAFQGRQTIEALERLKDKTFSLTCSFHFPHSPMLVPEPYYSMYPVEEMVPPVSINDNMNNSPYANSNSRNNRTEYSDPDKIKYMISEYYGIITEIDVWVGKILNKLDELGIAENTLVIFTSDHGEMLGAHGMREKNVFLEESARIPLLVSLPGSIQPATTVDGYVSLVDLFPTILDYLNVPEKESDGKSLRGLIEGTDTDHGKYVVTEWDRDNTPNYMVIKDGWKLIIPYTIKSTVINAMYDLNTDPHEMNNLLGSNPNGEQYLEKAEELRTCLLEWLAEKNSIHHYSVSKRDLIIGGKPTGNNAEFVSQTLPNLNAGKTVSVSITMKNTGTTTWTNRGNFKLASQSPAENKIWGITKISLNEKDSILPGQKKTFTFDVKVPEYDGSFIFQWQMIQEAEEWFGEKSEIEQIVVGDPRSYLDNCDENTGWKSSQGVTLNTIEKKQGKACIEFSGDATDEFKKVFTPAFNSGLTPSNAALQFWYYVSDPSVLSDKNQVELGSAGKPDVDEYNWKLTGLSEGWNIISLDILAAGKKGYPNIGAINWFRLYNHKSGTVTTRIDGIRIVDNTATSANDRKINSSKPPFNLYPNPLKNKWLTIDWTGTQKSKEVEISVFNLSGQTIYQKSVMNKQNIDIDTANWTRNSTYIITLSDGESVSSKKLFLD